MWVALERRNIRAILHYTGMLVLALAAMMVIPFLVAVFSAEWDPALDYLCGAGVTAAVGALLAQIEIEFEDGSTASIVTDESWKSAQGPIRMAEILHGTEYGTTLHYLPASLNESAWSDFLHVSWVGRRAKEIDTYLTEESTDD